MEIPSEQSYLRVKRVVNGITGLLRNTETNFSKLRPVRIIFSKLVELEHAQQEKLDNLGERHKPYVDCTGQEVAPPRTHNAHERLIASQSRSCSE